MTEFEQCLLMTLKDIKNELSSISDGLYSIKKELAASNERENLESHWDYEIHRDLDKIGTTLQAFCEAQSERL